MVAEPVTGVVCRLRNERDAARRERDEARSLVLRIGFRLREWVRDEQKGWTPGAVMEIYGMIDEWSFIADQKKDSSHA